MNVTTRIQPSSSIDDVFARQQQTALRLRTSTAAERIAKLKKLEAAVLANKEAIREALWEDLHRPVAEADMADIMPVISEIRHNAKHLRKWMRPRRAAPTMAMLGTKARVLPQPKGVALIIAPWNYPVNLMFGPLATAIAAGNAAMLKPSELSPASSAVMARIIANIFDPAEIALFEGDAAVSTALLALPFDHIFFTGSPAIGKIVMGAAAKNLTSVTLELGGKSPVIVDASADVVKAAKSVMWGKFINNGQTCIAPDYLYLHESILPQFLDEARKAIAKMYGPDAKSSPDYGRIINGRHFARVQRLLDDAIANGASVLAGNQRDEAQKYIAPTLLTNVSYASAVMQEEIFGPVLPVIPYRDIAEVIAHINDNQKPLALYIYSKDQDSIDRILGETTSGGACINIAMLHFSHNNLPFGGVNNSGIGATHGIYGFHEFSHQRAVLHDKMGTSAMLHPPYTPKVRRMIDMTLKYFT